MKILCKAFNHSWRLMTSEQDYGKWRSPHYGRYTGQDQEICEVCGTTRYVQGWQQWKYDLERAEKRVEYLKSTEPPKDNHHPRPSLADEGEKV